MGRVVADHPGWGGRKVGVRRKRDGVVASRQRVRARMRSLGLRLPPAPPAAKAQPHREGLGQPERAAAGFSRERGRVQGSATGAVCCAGRLGQIDIEGVEKKEKACAVQQLS